MEKSDIIYLYISQGLLIFDPHKASFTYLFFTWSSISSRSFKRSFKQESTCVVTFLEVYLDPTCYVCYRMNEKCA